MAGLSVRFGFELGDTSHSGLVDRGELEGDPTCECCSSWLLDVASFVKFVDMLLAALLASFVDITLLVLELLVGGLEIRG